ncbi:hypothetical protein Droror1_Dr00005418 [Drosera rotundifolia]
MKFSIAKSRSSTTAVIHPQPQQNPHSDDQISDNQPSTPLTLWKKSLLYCCCSGFTVFDSQGKLVYRVDNYTDRPEDVVLMDNIGRPIYSIRRHKTVLGTTFGGTGDHWVISDGESKTPACNVKRPAGSLLSGSRSNDTVCHLFVKGSSVPDYWVQGSYVKRSCKVLDRAGKVVVEIRNKKTRNGSPSFGAEVFEMVLENEFNSGLAMALVLVLDQMI